MEAIPTKTAAKSSTGKRLKAIAAIQRIADEYLNDIKIPTQIISLEARLPYYRNVQTSWVVLVPLSRMPVNVAGEKAWASSR